MEQKVYLLHFLIILFLSLLSLKFSFQILSQKILLKKTFNLSPLIIVYFVLIFIQSLTSLAYYMYSIILWRPDSVVYDSRILLILGLTCAFFLFLHPIVEILLCIDRCITVAIPFRYGPRGKMIYMGIALALLTIISAAVLFQVYSINTFPENAETTCRVYYCLGFFLSQKYSMIVRISMACISVFCCLMLAFLLKKNLNNNTAMRRVNRTVLIMIIASVCLDFCPNVIGQIFQSVSVFALYCKYNFDELW